MYPYGLIGNCQASALISAEGSIDWMCFPRPDSPPLFGRLLDPQGGTFAVESGPARHIEQAYLENTPVLATTVTCEDGTRYKITDFCPRFYQHGRIYRPNAAFRIIEPITGSSTIRVRCNPVRGWSKEPVAAIRGNSHLRYDIGPSPEETLRVVTNMPLTYFSEETPFLLKGPLYFGLSWSFGIEDDIVSLSQRHLERTLDYWGTWVKHCNVPTLYQRETIRSAITLKLHCYEDTGAILAAMTTSLPEESGHTRNWDYRYCWLRDSYYVLTAFQNLGHFEETEGFIKFLLNIAEKNEHSRERLRPVYRLDAALPLPEIEHINWAGFEHSRPVRSGNQAAEHVQNDVYGEMALTLAPIFFDERFRQLRTQEHERLLGHLARLCAKNISAPDAGLWELRNGLQEHSFSNLMCWAGLERIQRIRKKGYLKNLDFDLDRSLADAESAVRAAVKGGSLRNGPSDESFDAALLQLPILRFPDPDLSRQTLDRIYEELKYGEGRGSSCFLYRYRRSDDFGPPRSSFLICSYWLIQGLAQVGRIEEAREAIEDTLCSANDLGLFAEHYLPDERRQAGNFPQAYSHVGLINAAFAVSPPWSEVL